MRANPAGPSETVLVVGVGSCSGVQGEPELGGHSWRGDLDTRPAPQRDGAKRSVAAFKTGGRKTRD